MMKKGSGFRHKWIHNVRAKIPPKTRPFPGFSRDRAIWRRVPAYSAFANDKSDNRHEPDGIRLYVYVQGYSTSNTGPVCDGIFLKSFRSPLRKLRCSLMLYRVWSFIHRNRRENDRLKYSRRFRCLFDSMRKSICSNGFPVFYIAPVV